MKHNKSEGSHVIMKIAEGAMMTEHGEVMMQNNQPRSDINIGWILPVCRLQDELGLGVEYQTGGKTFL
eukprot:10980919-Lingulodinium_polyedra.AAC.1